MILCRLWKVGNEQSTTISSKDSFFPFFPSGLSSYCLEVPEVILPAAKLSGPRTVRVVVVLVGGSSLIAVYLLYSISASQIQLISTNFLLLDFGSMNSLQGGIQGCTEKPDTQIPSDTVRYRTPSRECFNTLARVVKHSCESV